MPKASKEKSEMTVLADSVGGVLQVNTGTPIPDLRGVNWNLFEVCTIFATNIAVVC